MIKIPQSKLLKFSLSHIAEAEKAHGATTTQLNNQDFGERDRKAEGGSEFAKAREKGHSQLMHFPLF